MPLSDTFERPATDVCLYIGARKTGKTHLALRHLAKRTGLPCLIVDSQGAENFQGHRDRVETVGDAIARVWSQRKHAVVTPLTDEAGDVLFEAAFDLGGAHVLVDEWSRWITSRRNTESLETLMRAGRHRMGLTLAMTTQHFSGDVPGLFFEIEPAWYIFRTKDLRARERLARQFEAEEVLELVKDLPNRHCELYPKDL